MSYFISIIGSGIIGAITSLMLFICNNKNIVIVFESNKKVSIENSKTLNNAGTGHAGMCENNYVIQKKENFFIKKNIRIYCKFEITKIFFSWIKYLKIFNFKKSLIKVPHVSFFFLKLNKIKLKKIFNKLKIFSNSIKFTSNIYYINKIYPLLLNNKKSKKKFTITYYKNGFDINYRLIVKKIFFFLIKQKNFFLYLETEVLKIKKKNFFYSLNIKKKKYLFDYVLICAGGMSYNLTIENNKLNLNKYLNFPIKGNWLINEKKKNVKNHNIKVYSETIKNNPPMSTPHLDLRNILNEKKILFGPYAGITFNILVTKRKFIFNDLNIKNFFLIILFTINNKILTKYLLFETISTKRKKVLNTLKFCNVKKFYLKNAGKRLQILKKKNNKIEIIFGTKLIFDKHKHLATILGASPGASISVYIAKKLIKNWIKFPKKFLPNCKNLIKKNKIFSKILYI
ncbi:malate:quinone oxidoreductase [Candidatus Carsonella ruddii PV]|uniref:malate dehydrogenase (quinone) n=1 Tax=Carsonella ruddii (strain PV) TaxID=387662 RepID=Q05FN3_CARRP|nr:malate:quinone oxidoreductase [Candidatus Carsonella ruddii]BAF35138.1 malate:quinone oxidoreductase [Candidatus Carsonella ruddii PV]